MRIIRALLHREARRAAHQALKGRMWDRRLLGHEVDALRVARQQPSDAPRRASIH
jgi:hypothetical protein